jgi:hypothetical protein
MRFKYTKEHIDFLKNVVPNRTLKEATRLFSNKFNISMTTTKVKSGVSLCQKKAKKIV